MAVCKLEMFGNNQLSVNLEAKLKELSQRGKFIPVDAKSFHRIYGYRMMLLPGYVYKNEFSKVEMHIHSWLSCWHISNDVVLPSWTNFFAILRDISPELRKTADQIQADFDQYLVRQPETGSEGMYLQMRVALLELFRTHTLHVLHAFSL